MGAYEAKTHLSQLLEEVAKGESIAITKHGVTVAILVPPLETKHRDAAAAVENWRRYRHEQGIKLGGLSIRELIDDGRR